jgi:hypothetical protein
VFFSGSPLCKHTNKTIVFQLHTESVKIVPTIAKQAMVDKRPRITHKQPIQTDMERFDMTTSLLTEFQQGYSARYACGRCLEHGNKPGNPYYASSPAGDAWEAGWSFACDKMAGNSMAKMPVTKVWSGRGDGSGSGSGSGYGYGDGYGDGYG